MKIAEGAGITFAQAEQLLNTVLSEFEGLQDMFDELKEFADEHGYARTDFGRRRYLMGIDSMNPGVYNDAIRAALNTPIQGSAADITMTAVRKTYALWQKLGIKAYNIQEVHDSIVVEVHYKDAYHVMTAGKDVIESVTCPSAKGKIKFEVDAVVGCHLGAKQKVNSEIIEMAKDDSLGLYKLLRKDLNYPPEYYIG